MARTSTTWAGAPHARAERDSRTAAGQQQVGVRLKQATHRLAELRFRQQRAQHQAVGGTEGADPVAAKRF